jgi:hypothetical protein
MDNFALLGNVALKLNQEFQSLYYVLLPLFFGVAIIIDWFKGPGQGGDFVNTLKRAFVATLLLVGFQEITGAILLIANGLSDKISDMSGLDQLLQMAGDKARSYPLSPTSFLLGANDLIIAVLSFLSYLVLYVLRYLMVAVYHFSWVFLTILAPFLLLFHLFTSKITLNLFRSMIEIASWQVVWSVLSAILLALPYGNAYVADGNYLTVIVINFVVAICMFGTPLIVHALVGSGFSAMAGSLGPLAASVMMGAPTKAASVAKVGREVLSDTYSFGKAFNAKLGQKSTDVGRMGNFNSRLGESSMNLNRRAAASSSSENSSSPAPAKAPVVTPPPKT